jgi:LysM repeat protein
MSESRHIRIITTALLLVVLVAVFSMDYTVRSGDTLGRIARDHGVSLSDLISANDISNPDLIRPGQVLVIPGKGGSSGVTHVVARGDTLGRIAARYGASVSSLIAANDLGDPDLIRIGQRLQVPGASGSGQGSGSSGHDDPTVRSGETHIVKAGDTLASIAAQHTGLTAESIAASNGIVGGVIYRGTRLFVDGPVFVGKGTRSEVTHTVGPGDRLGDIAHEYGVAVNTILDANDISDPDLIRLGEKLVIPIGARWVCPVTNASYSNTWGFPRAGGRFHEGNDLFVARGTPIRAPVGGTVEFKTGSIGGKQFNLQGSDGIMYLGSHMDAFGTGGKVAAGTVVGYVGTTGNAEGTSPHLHFGMYHPGGVINPYPSLVANDC